MSEAKREYDRMTHEWYEKLPNEKLIELNHVLGDYNAKQKLVELGWSGDEVKQGQKYNTLHIKVGREPRDTSPRATSYYNTVSAFDTKEPMPEWTTSKEGRNVQRVDVVIPTEGRGSKIVNRRDVAGQYSGYEPLWQPDNLHENLPNTLGWAMIQYKTGPKGEKIAVIAEAQSRWQQQKREYWKIYNDLIAKGQHDPQEAHYEASTKVNQYRQGMDTESNVEKDYNRLILKAAIEQARKEGATHIMVSDAETAMMTEGHDTVSGWNVVNEEGKIILRNASEAAAKEVAASENGTLVQVRPEQEPGMRLNYDTILPKIAEELTGSKGEKVSLGEHKNAYNFKDQPWTLRDENGDYISNFATEADAWDFARNHRNKDKYTLKKDEGNIRTDLIFRNPDGTPKTDVSGVMYPLEQVSKRLSEGDNFTLFNKYATEDENLGAGRRAFFKPLESTFDKVNQIGLPKIAEAGRRWEVKRDMYVGKGNAALKDLSKFKVDDINRVAEARRKAFRSGSAYNPAGVDAEINNVFKQYYHDVIGKQRRLLGITIMGRKAGLNENYMPDTLAPEAIDTLVNKPATPEAKALINDWVKHIVTESGGKVTPKEAREYVEAYTNAVAGNDSNYLSVKYGAIRKAEGYGLPDSIREQDATQSLSRYARRAGADLAMFEELENKPEIAAALGLNDPKTGKTVTLPGVDNESKRGEVRDMMKWVTGSFTGGTFARQSPLTSAVVRLVNNMLLGPATAVRDTASIPANMVPYLTEAADFSAVANGIRKMHENARASLEAGATQPNLDRTQFNDLVNSPDAVVSFTREAARYARLVQRREHIENFNRDLTFSIGKELAKIKVEGAKAGNVKAKQWLEKFDTALDGDVTKMSGADLEKAINTIAKNFTDRNQGTYGGRGLPVGIVDNQFAPFFALQKWSVEKSNVIWKDVVKPAIDGKNYLPLLTYTVGSVLTGAGIQQLNKLLSGRKSQDPELKEVLAHGRPQDYAAQLATLMQLGSFAGIIGDAAKMTTDPLVYGKLPRNVVSFPTATAAQNFGERIMNVSEAIRNGDDPVKVLSLFSLDLMSHNIQAARMIANRTAKADDIERSDKFRDLRTFQMLEGGKAPDFGSVNPYLNLEDKEFKRTDDLGVASQLAERMIQKKIEKAGGDYEKLSSSMRSASQNSYRTMPSLKDSPLSFQRYYNFLVETQGREEADRRMEEFLRQQMLNEVKSGMIPRI